MYWLVLKVDENVCGMISGVGLILFEEFGFYYIGLVDGYNLDDLVLIFKEVKSIWILGLVFIYVVIEKGYGYFYVERVDDKYYGKKNLINNIFFFLKNNY